MCADPPLAYDIDQADFDWSTSARIEVLLDGEVETQVLAYDTGEGWVRRFVADEAGKPIFDPDAGIFSIETVRGNVAVRWRVTAAEESA